MRTPLVPVQILSIYKRGGNQIFLPQNMARCTPDTCRAILSIQRDLEGRGGKLILSDLFRSYDMQLQAHLDYETGKKSAFSPAPGGSMHEAGRAFDLDLASIKIPLAEFWQIAEKYGVSPIITRPDTGLSEAWHFDCRGSHGAVYEYYKRGDGTNFKPYEAMAKSAILELGIRVDAFSGKETEACIQSGLIRLGYTIGNLDGIIGRNTRSALEQAGVRNADANGMLTAVQDLLQDKFAAEYRAVSGLEYLSAGASPEHVIT
jgi:D-alanyl-D-alanine dipeptidase